MNILVVSSPVTNPTPQIPELISDHSTKQDVQKALTPSLFNAGETTDLTALMHRCLNVPSFSTFLAMKLSQNFEVTLACKNNSHKIIIAHLKEDKGLYRTVLSIEIQKTQNMGRNVQLCTTHS